jgi:hypothetical protein
MQEKNALERFFSPGIRTSVVLASPQCSADPTPRLLARVASALGLLVRAVPAGRAFLPFASRAARLSRTNEPGR